ncbi:hypothetical protein NitaMp017 (mitochondrion) [Nicotiana tabacum]|uniref:Uncharacterized protein n=1 Tax=Nicotiana tabacum TaxID=4097 RepID=Q5MA50_TOBAC|nr:hypothetical protein NitaMp017 [Nicotiana tabacum]BAD83428.1 hypothetical protein [Nicotiana tabacum]
MVSTSPVGVLWRRETTNRIRSSSLATRFRGLKRRCGLPFLFSGDGDHWIDWLFYPRGFMASSSLAPRHWIWKCRRGGRIRLVVRDWARDRGIGGESVRASLFVSIGKKTWRH